MDLDTRRGPEVIGVDMQFPEQIPPTLVKYDPPIFAGLEPSLGPNSRSDSKSLATATDGEREPITGAGGGNMGGRDGRGHKIPRADGQGKTSQLDDMVNSMLPPREWTEETGTWIQYVSKDPATRLAVITLQVQGGRRNQNRRWM